MARQLSTGFSICRFEAVWQRNLLNSAESADIAAALMQLYAEQGRHYHTLDHIEFCLSVFDQVSNSAANPDAVELAIWFHDAIYNFPIQDNERLSAEYFMRVSADRLPNELRERVSQMVLVTEHDEQPEDADQQMIVDIDLSSFGRPWQQFSDDGKNVRHELGYLEDTDFYTRQIKFMSHLVAREHFYNLQWFREKFEVQARANVTRYLEFMAEQGYRAN